MRVRKPVDLDILRPLSRRRGAEPGMGLLDRVVLEGHDPVLDDSGAHGPLEVDEVNGYLGPAHHTPCYPTRRH